MFCNDEYWVTPEERAAKPVMFSPLRQGIKEWKDLYGMRQTIERLFKSVKQSRGLESHCTLGLDRVRLHVLMSKLSYTAKRWVQAENNVEDAT